MARQEMCPVGLFFALNRGVPCPGRRFLLKRIERGHPF